MSLKVVALSLFVALVFCFIYKTTRTSEPFSSGGFSVTSGLSYYNKPRFCEGGNIEGSSDPYCESIGQVAF